MMRAYESKHRITFPVRKLLLIITKSLYCPPNLEDFNKNGDVPQIEACQSLPDVERNVAGVQNRIYRNTAYKLRRRAADPRPVHVLAECATPIHTLCRVLQKRSVYQRLASADGEEIQRAFCETIMRIVDSSPELRGKMELVYYDDTDPNSNIAEVVLAKVHEIENRNSIRQKD
ncbi:transmembrane protein sting isoform X2 [Choristoneura fumiferana]|uniref:transmembrane protein sting isoform X2 n=1 Tax=Choristoneura fumiferana TaxID=7141 RepID=UPI003D15603D